MNQYINIAADEAYQLMHQRSNVVVLDVRREDEYCLSHLENALHIPLDQLEIEVKDKITDLTIPIIVYCRSGVRSKKASEILIKLGYTSIYNMLGGILAYHYEIEKSNHC